MHILRIQTNLIMHLALVTTSNIIDMVNNRVNMFKTRKIIEEYINTSFIPLTSIVLERLFSQANLVLTDRRTSMS